MLTHNIKCMCDKQGKSMQEIGVLAGFEQKSIYRITPNSSALKLMRIAKLLGTTVEELLEGEDVKGN